MRDQAIGFQNFGNLLLGLDFRQPSDVQAHRYQGDTNGSSLADTHFPTEFFNIKNIEVQQVAIAKDIVVRGQPRGGGHLTNAVVNLLWRFENGLLSATGRRQNQ